jgi:uroporphyrin-III C-methyltransferase
MKGKVYLAGAGPGDPELLTVKALRLLKTADVVLHDELVSQEILNVVSPAAQLYKVGKRCGARTVSQAEINFLMVALASSGLTVVRLKSGDPMIFGRCGEEIQALRKADIECEVVPGITAALGAASAAQIPLTHRQISHALIFLTAHAADESESVEWKKCVSSGATIAIYMPGHNYKDLAARLMSAGLHGETPCAIISAATTRDQEIVVSTVCALPSLRSLPTPSLLLVGDTVALAQQSTNLSEPSQVQEERVQPAPADHRLFMDSGGSAESFGVPSLV